MIKDMLRTLVCILAGVALAVTLLWFSSVLLRAVLSSPAHAAPAPPKKVKPAPKAPQIGHWTMTWRGMKFDDTKFNADGSYTCGRSWTGVWQVEGKALHVHEELVGGDLVLDWSVILATDTSGNTVDAGGVFELSPFAAPPDAPKITD